MATIVWQGTSEFDGVAVTLAVTDGSVNAKTGDCPQAFVLETDRSPADCERAQDEAATCGTCPHRRGGSLGDCYVVRFQSPGTVYSSLPNAPHGAVTGDTLRLSAFGDAGAVPADVVSALCSGFRRVIGYTHAWRTRPDLRKWCTASCETEADVLEARARGWNTFRMLYNGAPLDIEGECLNSTKGLKCVECGLCKGRESGKPYSVFIRAHGARSAKLVKV